MPIPWAALMLISPKKKGSFEPGKLADLIVRHDPFSARPKQLVDLTIDLTMLSGKIVHSI